MLLVFIFTRFTLITFCSYPEIHLALMPVMAASFFVKFLGKCLFSNSPMLARFLQKIIRIQISSFDFLSIRYLRFLMSSSVQTLIQFFLKDNSNTLLAPFCCYFLYEYISSYPDAEHSYYLTEPRPQKFSAVCFFLLLFRCRLIKSC